MAEVGVACSMAVSFSPYRRIASSVSRLLLMTHSVSCFAAADHADTVTFHSVTNRCSRA